MATLKFLHSVHLSPRFGGVEHGEKLESPDIKRGMNVEIRNDRLAKLLITRGLAERLKIESAKSEKAG